MNYYNDNDPYCCAWLRNLIAEGLIAPGDVDERSITEVQSSDLRGYRQCHFFAGIAGWPFALRLAGWPDDEPVWTGSCPCQPFSAAGDRRGHLDERHLWPAFHNLIAHCRPATIFGEQVARADGIQWLSAVRVNLENLGYAVGAADLPAAGVGSPQIRQRLYWVADADGHSNHSRRATVQSDQRVEPTKAGSHAEFGRCGLSGGLEHPPRRPQQWQSESGAHTQGSAGVSGSSFWAEAEWIPCLDGKSRPTKPRVFPLAHGISDRVAKLRAPGNAIVPPLAAEFIKAYMSI